MNRTRRKRSQSGNAAVELALVFLPLMALLMAILDFSLPIFLRSVFAHATREGARYGITYRTSTGLGHKESIKRVVQRNAAGFLNGTTGLSHIRVEFYRPPDMNTALAGPTSNEGGNIVEVSITGFRWDYIMPIWRPGGGLNVGASSADRLETLPAGVARPAP